MPKLTPSSSHLTQGPCNPQGEEAGRALWLQHLVLPLFSIRPGPGLLWLVDRPPAPSGRHLWSPRWGARTSWEREHGDPKFLCHPAPSTEPLFDTTQGPMALREILKAGPFQSKVHSPYSSRHYFHFTGEKTETRIKNGARIPMQDSAHQASRWRGRRDPAIYLLKALRAPLHWD